jgi:seryl-tRNA synthetase
MQMQCESDKKEKELFEENKAANLRMQSKHEEFTKLSVKIEHFRGESQNLKAERDKLLQDIDKVSQSEDTLQKEVKVQSEEIQTRQVKCGCAWCKNQKP